MDAYILIMVAIYGLIFGSFINALVWRLYKQSSVKTKEKKASFAIIRGRSQCVYCKTPLRAKDLIPVFSWVGLKGRCRYCNKSISRQYPFIELLTACCFVFSYIFWPYTFNGLQLIVFVFWLALFVIFISLLVYDLKWMILPNKLVFAATVIALILRLILGIYQDNIMQFVGALFAGILFFCFFLLLFEVSKGKWIGGGDVKLAFCLGLIAGGIFEVALLVFVASFIGTLVSLPMMISKKYSIKTKIPFGPFLILATVLVFLFGSAIINWYKQKILYL